MNADKLADALRKLIFAAQTSGGVSGRDDELCRAIGNASIALDEYDAQPAQAAQPDAARGLIIQWRHNAQGCGRFDRHAAATWRSCASQLEALFRGHGLSECDSVRVVGDVDKGIPVSASRAQKEAPIIVDVGTDSGEHDRKAAVLADPHDGESTPTVPAPTALHAATADLVRRFSAALAEKLAAAEQKYGYSDNWARPDWMDECRQHLLDHIAKGDPRDVAAYCAFLWHHGEHTSPAQPVGVPDIAAARRAIEARNRYLYEHPGDAVDAMVAALQAAAPQPPAQPVYQYLTIFGWEGSFWRDCSKEDYDKYPVHMRRILYAQPVGVSDADEERAIGVTAARNMAEHLRRMRAESCSVPVFIGACRYVVTVAPLADKERCTCTACNAPAYCAPQPPAQPSADAVSIAADISTRPEFAKYESPLILAIVRETLKAARAAEGGE